MLQFSDLLSCSTAATSLLLLDLCDVCLGLCDGFKEDLANSFSRRSQFFSWKLLCPRVRRPGQGSRKEVKLRTDIGVKTGLISE